MNYSPDFWHWWILGVALVILEAFAPGAFFVWMGVAAIAVGFLLWLIPVMTWEAQFLIFAGLSIATIVGWRMWFRKYPEETDQPNLNRRGEQYIGRSFTLETAIDNGVGRVRVGDSLWRAVGDDMPAGSRVKVVGVDGASLKVEAD
ncbi:MAG: NfeD family protein [Gammaproteobacteria bacterium]|nr:NfeD family protein [Gammaproteobacteria bacterium]MCP5138170.1 NfeD family protein [Gammaproteobacteria bacterium]